MQQTGEFDPHGNPERENCEVVVDAVEHAMRTVHLRSQLSNHAREEDHGHPTAPQKHIRNDIRKSANFGVR
jgi:hypothetical protein